MTLSKRYTTISAEKDKKITEPAVKVGSKIKLLETVKDKKNKDGLPLDKGSIVTIKKITKGTYLVEAFDETTMIIPNTVKIKVIRA